jgi:large subunit ribosomal protein L37Ae
MVTKKVGSTGRFGARYGKKLRTKVLEVEKRQLKKQVCPYCGRFQVKRQSAGVFDCKKCGTTFTGDAYMVKI